MSDSEPGPPSTAEETVEWLTPETRWAVAIWPKLPQAGRNLHANLLPIASQLALIDLGVVQGSAGHRSVTSFGMEVAKAARASLGLDNGTTFGLN